MKSIETAVVVVIVLSALIYVGWKTFKALASFRKKKSGGCDDCSKKSSGCGCG